MKTNHSIENPGWEQLARYLAGESSSAEKAQVEAWAGDSEQNSRELEELRMLFKASDRYFEISRFDTGAAWQKVQQKAVHKVVRLESKSKTAYASILKYAAILILAIFAGSAGYYLVTSMSQEKQHIVFAGEQTVNEITLPDGTLVTLNSSSTLEYPRKFNGNMREVTITGEAFFDVQPDPDKPFVINAGNMQVKVLGTSFNVRAYPEAESVEVVVETGLVQVTNRNGEVQAENAILMLNPGEKGILYNLPGTLEKSFNTNPNYIAWKTRNLIFNKTPLREVVQYLEDIYHVDIQLENNELEKLVLTAHFERKPHDFILNVIQLTFGLELTRENGAYILSENSELKK
jgi:transmembrane sensor